MRTLLVLFLLHASASYADELGRLFFSPEQRAMLDLSRNTRASAGQAVGDGYDGVTLSGIVTRNDGRRMVWINGQPQLVAPGGSASSATIRLPGGEGKVRLKVGQTLDPASGKVEEGYRRPPPVASPDPVPVAAPARKPAQNKPATNADDGPDDAPSNEPAR